ncbi:MAG: phosphatase PAP2 family protein [bacterium]|nr:phosphatase PAP2 family protein [bacterium]
MEKKQYLNEFSLIEIINLAYLLFLLILAALVFILKINTDIINGIALYIALILMIFSIHYLRFRNIIHTNYYNIFYLCIIPLVFNSMQYVVPYLFKPADVWLSQVENTIMFGFLPSLYFQHTISQNSLLNTTLMISYVIYFFLPAFIISYHFFSKQRRLILKDILYITLGLYFCYIGYIFIPAFGPRFYYHYDVQLAGGKIFNFFMTFINITEKNKLDAFPSAHIEMACIILYLIRKNKFLFFLLLAEFIGIFLSTILLRFHYIIDIYAGFLFFYLAVKIGNKLEKKFNHPFGPDS